MDPPDRHPPNKPIAYPESRNQIQRYNVNPYIISELAWNYLEYYFSPITTPVNNYVVKPIQMATRYVWDIGVDGNHPWKQAKYFCALREITDSLPDDMRALKNFNLDDLPPLQAHLKSLIKLLYRPDNEFDDGCRTKHREFIKLLRKSLLSEDYQTEYRHKLRGTESFTKDIDRIHQLAAAIYDVHLYTFADSVISGAIRKGLEVCSADPETAKMMGIDSLSIEKQRRAIQQLPQSDKAPLIIIWINNFIGVLGKGFDPHSIGNVPYVLYDLKVGAHTTRFVRTGTPTIGIPDPDVEGSQAVMSPEFQAYLRHCRQTDKKVFYFNLQSATQGAEKTRTEAIKAGFDREGMGDSFFTLDHDSEYYTQSGKWDSLTDAKEFKKSIVNHLFNHPNYHCPDQVQQDEAFVSGIRELLEQIHTDVFFGEERLDQRERRDFLDIFYSLFIFLAMMYYKPDTIMIACKDALDRAGKTNFLLIHLMMIYTKDMSPETKHKRMVTTFAPPFLVKKKEIIRERFERMQQCFERLSQQKVISNLYSRAKSSGLDQAISFITHDLDHQKFSMETGRFEAD